MTGVQTCALPISPRRKDRCARSLVAMVDASRGRAWIARLAPWSGPLLIVAWSLVALRGFLVGGRLSDQHPDLLTFWLPRSCLLGDALRDGRLPLWNPHELFGTPFLADPQSGWLSLLWTTLPTALGCGRGLDRKSTRLNSSHMSESRMPSSA